jgi:hypothetical protein
MLPYASRLTRLLDHHDFQLSLPPKDVDSHIGGISLEQKIDAGATYPQVFDPYLVEERR